MTDEQVQLFLADLAIIILLARLLGMAAERLGQPPVLGEIIAGILLGPTLFHGKITATLFPVSVLVLLPVFFVVSGLSVNLSSVGLSGLTELCLILLVAVVGKFGGAFIGASLAGPVPGAPGFSPP